MIAPRSPLDGSMSRREILAGALGACALPLSGNRGRADEVSKSSLGEIAARNGLLFGGSFSTAELDKPSADAYARMYAHDARILTSELEFKMGALRPKPDQLDFYAADRLVEFAEQHKMKVRGHTLIWNDNLPDWIKALPAEQCRALLDQHVETVVTRFGPRVAYWDVVNEPIGPWDRKPGNLRGGAFYEALGEGYIKRAFEVARKFAPNATLVLNEAQMETDDENGKTFRDSFMALVRRLHDAGAPIDAIGFQSHLKVTSRYDLPAFAGFLSEFAAMGYAIHVTELDVNDAGVSGSVAERDAKVAALYKSYLTEVLKLPAVKIVELWQFSDASTWLRDPTAVASHYSRADARPLIYDDAFQKKAAWYAVAQALTDAPPR